ncbi:unnamed protein product [Trifolium pratense]|uniref:Uncharacterized protein n=1 Tax=Trifolium pratense TaxID=57577 RepID=A0ACB0JMC5_TRIPR|nr:unnamed protein product [Trifolium pratense]
MLGVEGPKKRTILFDSTTKNQSYKKSTTTIRVLQWLQELFLNNNPEKQACANVAPKPVPTADDGVRTWAYLHFVGIVTNERKFPNSLSASLVLLSAALVLLHITRLLLLSSHIAITSWFHSIPQYPPQSFSIFMP